MHNYCHTKNMDTQQKRFGRQRLHVDLPERLFKELKIMAVERQTTMTKIVIGALIEKIKRERGIYEDSKGDL